MSDIDALRNRVEAAERSFGLIDERERSYSTRLINLIGGIEDQLRRHQSEIAEREARESVLEHENQELRAMLHSLLLAVEDGGQDQLGGAINDMDHRVTALLAGHSAQSSSAEGEVAPADPMAETPDAAATTEAQDDDAAPMSESAASEADQSPLADLAPEGLDTLDLETEASSADADETPIPEAADGGAAEESAPEDIAAEGDAASLEDALIEAVAEAIELEPATGPAPGTSQDTALDSSAMDSAGEEIPEHDELLAELGLADLEPSKPDGMAGDEPASLDPPAEHPFDSSIEGTDVVMADGEPAEPADQEPVADHADQALAERAEKIAQLLSSGDDSDPSVKEIIEKVTELAETLAPSGTEVVSEEIDLTVEPVDESAGGITGGSIEAADFENLEEVTAA